MHHKAIEPDWIVECARQLHDDGWGYKRIAKKLDVAVSTIRDWVKYKTH